MRLLTLFVAALLGFAPSSGYALFGEEIPALLELIAGQVREIEQLTQAVGIAKEHRDLALEINRGIDQAVSQIRSVQSVLERVQGLNPTAARSIADLNDYLARMEAARRDLDQALGIKAEIAGVAIGQAAVQSETSYRMGQEMVLVGLELSQESQLASPGRAAQISAAAGSAQMLAQGVELQTLAQIAQLQAMSLELQKAQIEREQSDRRAHREFLENRLGSSEKPKSKSGGVHR